MTKPDSRNLLKLFNDEETPKIYSLKGDENEFNESDSIEWCPTWSNDQVASVQESPVDPEAVPPDELPAFQAVNHERGRLGVDFRPHLYDPGLKELLLCDSGSQITAVPPDPGDNQRFKKFGAICFL